MLHRIKLLIRYDGSSFYGFQRQSSSFHPTVAGAIEDAFLKIGIQTRITGSGRTDRGVHALRQVAHCDIPLFWSDCEKLQHHLNRCLFPHIYITSIESVDKEFHARFNAKRRLYRYIAYEGAFEPFLSAYALHVKGIDVAKLHKHARLFQGKHSFTLFKKEGGAPTPDERTLFRAGAYRHGKFIILFFEADAFLRSQIRMMCDMLLKVNCGTLSEDALTQQRDGIAQHSRTLAPACGLYLCKIYY